MTNHLYSFPCCGGHLGEKARLACRKRSDQPELYLSADDLVVLMIKLSPNATSLTVRNWADRNSRGIPPCLRDLKQSIVKLDLTGPNIDDEGMIEIVGLYSTSLRELVLNACFLLTRRTWSTIPKCTELQRLKISDVLPRDRQVEDIILHCRNLEKLELFGTEVKLTHAGLVDLHRLQHLRHLVLGCERSLEIASILGKITNLEFLGLDMPGCDIAIFREIATLKNLRTLILPFTDIKVTPECFDVICNNFRKLRKLRVAYLVKLTNADAVKLNLLKELECLMIYGRAKFTDLTSNGDFCLSALKTLSVSSDVITAAALANFAARHPHLENLFIF